MKNKLSELMFTGAFAAIAAALLTHDSFAGGNTIHVPADHPTIQAAIDAANPAGGDEIIVAPGTYNETINFNGKAVHLRSSGGPEVTIIDATGIGGSVVLCVNGEGPDTTLEGFTITGGAGSLAGASNFCGDDVSWYANGGGGMSNYASNPTIIGCIFKGNAAPTVYDGNPNPEGQGGAMRNLFSNPTVTNCVFHDNWAEGTGGAIYNYQSNPIITDCTFIQNAAGSGGAIHNFCNSSSAIGNSIFSGNEPNDIDGPFTDLGGNEFSGDCPLCPADLTGSGSVGVPDLLQVLQCWGSVGQECFASDLDGDGVVGVADLVLLLSAWGPCP